MEITDVKITLVDQGKLRAFATIVLDDCIAVHGLKVIQGQSGLFVAMPSRSIGNGGDQDVAHPINNATRKWMETVIIDKYKEALADGLEASGVRSPLLPPHRPLYGRQAREMRDDDREERGDVCV
jgi:stage V sporulation protein G